MNKPPSNVAGEVGSVNYISELLNAFLNAIMEDVTFEATMVLMG